MERKKLNGLLNFIKEIADFPGNEWFKDQLAKTFSSNTVKKESKNLTFLLDDSASLEEKVDLIRNYLAIDLQNLIDYSWFEEPSREQLFRDCIEMCRFEKGTPNHRKNFGEFCRYAHLQAEEMINYFFNKVTGNNVSLLDEYLKQTLANYQPTKKPTSIFHISYSFKLTAFKGLVDFEKKTHDHLYFLNDFRNELSHRNSSSIEKEDKILIDYENLGLAGRYIDFNSLSAEQLQIHRKSKFIITKRKEEFFLVYQVLEDLKSKVIQSLEKGIKLNTSSNSLGSINPELQKLKERFK